MNELENRVRQLLRERAGEAPSGGGLAERILAAVDEPAAVYELGAVRSVRRRWVVPMLAAAAVVALAVGVLLGAGLRHHNEPLPASPSHGQVSATPTSNAPSPTMASSATASPSASDPTLIHLQGFQPIDLTWVGENDGYALGTADCLKGSGRCTGLIHTTDGAYWYAILSTPFNINSTSCTYRCVDGIRFANDEMGYVYGPTVLFMTVDGGRHWTQQSGGASDIEVANGTAVRISQSAEVPQISAVGTTTWRPIYLPSQNGLPIAPLRLARSGAEVMIDAAGQNATDIGYLSRSTDDGLSWTALGRTCPRGDDFDLQVAPGGGGAWLCGPHDPGSPEGFSVVYTSNGGTTRYTVVLSTSATALRGAELAMPDAQTVLVATYALGRSPILYRIQGTTKQMVQQAAGSATTSEASYLGCETSSVCRWVPGNGNELYTSRNGGQTWTRTSF